MEHESFEKKTNVEETDLTFEKIYEMSWFPSEVADEVKKANFLIIPSDISVCDNELLFPETTSDFLEYLNQEKPENVVFDIAISDNNYRRIEKHSALIEVAAVLVNSGILPIAINLISSFLYDLAIRYRRTPDDASAKVKIFAEETKTKKTVKIEYEGPVSDIKKTLEQTIKSVLK